MTPEWHVLPAATPPVMHEVVDDLGQLADGPAFLDEITGGGVQGHHAVAHAPAPLSFRIEPDDALHPLADEPERPRLRVIVVVPRVAQDEDGRLLVQRVQLRAHEAVES